MFMALFHLMFALSPVIVLDQAKMVRFIQIWLIRTHLSTLMSLITLLRWQINRVEGSELGCLVAFYI